MIVTAAALAEIITRLDPDTAILFDTADVDADEIEDADAVLEFIDSTDVLQVVQAGPYPGSLIGAQVRPVDYIVVGIDGPDGLRLRPIVRPGRPKTLAGHLKSAAASQRPPAKLGSRAAAKRPKSAKRTKRRLTQKQAEVADAS